MMFNKKLIDVFVTQHYHKNIKKLVKFLQICKQLLYQVEITFENLCNKMQKKYLKFFFLNNYILSVAELTNKKQFSVKNSLKLHNRIVQNQKHNEFNTLRFNG